MNVKQLKEHLGSFREDLDVYVEWEGQILKLQVTDVIDGRFKGKNIVSIDAECYGGRMYED